MISRRLIFNVVLPCIAVGLSGSTLHASSPPPEKTPDFAGTWMWSWKDSQGRTHQHVLEIEGTGSTLAGRERFDDEGPVRVTEIKTERNKVQFTVVRGARRAEYRGVIDKSDDINGTVVTTDGGETQEAVWKAKRKPTPKESP